MNIDTGRLADAISRHLEDAARRFVPLAIRRATIVTMRDTDLVGNEAVENAIRIVRLLSRAGAYERDGRLFLPSNEGGV